MALVGDFHYAFGFRPACHGSESVLYGRFQRKAVPAAHVGYDYPDLSEQVPMYILLLGTGFGFLHHLFYAGHFKRLLALLYPVPHEDCPAIDPVEHCVVPDRYVPLFP